MLQLIYVSTARDSWDRRFDALCVQAGTNNIRDEITGVLIEQNGCFLQVLEGPQSIVEDTFIRIVSDSRRHALLLLSRRLLTRRQFGNWPMAQPQGEARDAAIEQVRALVAADAGAAATLLQRLGR